MAEEIVVSGVTIHLPAGLPDFTTTKLRAALEDEFGEYVGSAFSVELTMDDSSWLVSVSVKPQTLHSPMSDPDLLSAYFKARVRRALSTNGFTVV